MASVSVYVTMMYRCDTCAFWSLGNTDESLNRIEQHLAGPARGSVSRQGHDGHWFPIQRARIDN